MELFSNSEYLLEIMPADMVPTRSQARHFSILHDERKFLDVLITLGHPGRELILTGILNQLSPFLPPEYRPCLLVNLVGCGQELSVARSRLDMFKVNVKKTKDPERANQHSYCIRYKQVSLLCYDKIDQLKMAGHCLREREDAAVLRLEVQLKRPALKRALGKRALEDNAALLKAASDQVAEVIHSYLSRMFPCSGTHLQYEDAVSVVQKIKKETLREQMLYLLRKVSDAATWDSASRKLNEHYTDVTDKQIKKIHCKFDELGISPITLLDNRSMKSLPPLSQFFE